MTRIPFDSYPTPPWCTELLMHEYPPPTNLVLEPAAGEGGMVDVLGKYGHRVLAIDIQDMVKKNADKSFVQLALHADFLKVKFEQRLTWKLSIVTNPPYSLALEFLDKSFDSGAIYIAMLLRLDFLSSKKRAAFHNSHPLNRLLILGKRPSFTGSGTDRYDYAWFIWDKSNTYKPPRILMPTQEQLKGKQ